MKKQILTIILLSIVMVLNAQDMLNGTVKEYSDDEKEIPVVGAILQWKGSPIGTVTDVNGNFSIEKTSATDSLIIKYHSYQNDTVQIEQQQKILNIILTSAHRLGTVTIAAQRTGAYISVKPILTNIITSDGLRKAACCNLSESFDNTVAVDVEYSDAVSGAKQISMLGLAGIYSQILLENVPYVRLLSNQFGLGFIPGSWMEAISVSKGISSVTNGYEAITGQINVDYKKPETNKEKLFLNLFGNSMGKGELNLNSRFKVKENVSTMFLLHTEGQFAKIDMNHDSFIDIPINYQVNAMNRWDYVVPNKMEGRTMVSYLWEDRVGGQMNFIPRSESNADSIYGLKIETNKINFITKNGFLLKGEHESIGTILSLTYHKNRSFFGFRHYDAEQLSGYANIMYSNRYGQNERHKLTAGGSFQIDELRENLSQLNGVFLQNTSLRSELVPGIFAEYSYSIDEKFIIMTGMRVDYNLFYNQLFWTPRVHLKWMPAKNSSIRISLGKGYRTANVVAENISLLVSNRNFVFLEELAPEEAYNAGISFVHSFMMRGGNSNFTVDYYYTHFVNQTIIDLDSDPQSVLISNLNGHLSNSHSFQAELNLYPLKRFEIVIAYRYNRVFQTTAGELQQKALMSPHKALLNLNYATKFDKWKFSATLQYNSSMRLPDTKSNPERYRLSSYSPDYLILNAQITKKFKKVELYIGGENLLNYKQKNPILSADNPFGEYFDASIIYAPINGIMGYVGFRWTIE